MISLVSYLGAHSVCQAILYKNSLVSYLGASNDCQACLYSVYMTSLVSYLGALSVCLACRYKISLVVPFPLDQEHQLARGVSCADNTLRLQRRKNVFQISITELNVIF